MDWHINSNFGLKVRNGSCDSNSCLDVEEIVVYLLPEEEEDIFLIFFV